MSSQLRSQQSRLQKDLLDVQQLAAQQKAGLLTQEAMLDGQLHELDAQLTIAGLQATSSRNLLERIRPLAARGYVSAFQIQAQEDQALAADSQLKSLRRQRYEISQQSSNVRNQLLQLPLVTEGKLSDLHRQLAQVEQSLAQNEADRESIMRATQDGIISSTLVRPGQAISAGQALLTVVPANSPLYAELFAPSSAIGFVHTGTRVVLHYQAFPYQKFGLQRGVVEGISRNALTPNEVAMMIGQQAPNEALYRVLVKLESQTIQAYGKPESLRPGMILDADLLLDRRRLIEWIFEPLFGMHRRVEVEGQSVEKASQERTP